MQHNKKDNLRYISAVDILLAAKRDMGTLRGDLKSTLVELEAQGEVLKQEAAARNPRRITVGPPAREMELDPMDKGKQKARQQSVAVTDDSSGEGGLPKTPAGDECRWRMHSIRSRMRECEIVLHQIHFFLGDAYNMLGETYSAKEDAAYNDADEIRKRLLKSA